MCKLDKYVIVFQDSIEALGLDLGVFISFFDAEDIKHAEEQAKNAYPNSKIELITIIPKEI